MGIRQWLRQQIREHADDGELPAGASFLHSVMGDESEQVHALGEFTALTYPQQLAELLRRRESVAAELMTMDFGSREGRHAAIPHLLQLLQRYPHPLAYDALILAYVDDLRWDEARGTAFAARERRLECENSPWPEIRSECSSLKGWAPEDVDVLREEREGRLVTPGVPTTAGLSPTPSLA
jgi:hypothetical protein